MNGWPIPCGMLHAICATFTDLLSDGKTPYERPFGKPFNRPVIPFGAMVEHHTISAKDSSRLHQFGPKVLTGFFPQLCIACGWNVERRHCDRRH